MKKKSRSNERKYLLRLCVRVILCFA